MAKADIVFRRIGGKLVPIHGNDSPGLRGGRAVVGAYRAAKGVKSAIKSKGKSAVAPHRGLQALGFAGAVADGILSGATFFGTGAKAFIAGQSASVGLSVGSSAANVASFAGKGHARERAKGAIRQEAINTVAGNLAFGATLLVLPSSRRKIFEYVGKAAKFVAGAV